MATTVLKSWLGLIEIVKLALLKQRLRRFCKCDKAKFSDVIAKLLRQKLGRCYKVDRTRNAATKLLDHGLKHYLSIARCSGKRC
jgi:hypothetical protein